MKAKSPTTYSHKEIEQKWIKIWENSHLYETPKGVRKENKYYILPQLPYPSGEGLHVGHAEVYTSCDIYARFQRMKGKKVLQVIGWDAFGLPAENFAIKNNVHPRINTDKAIHNFRKQIKSLGISVDWSREVGSHNPDYYKFTQWFFLLMYNQGLAYRNKQIVNWCDGCKTVLANEQVVEGKCERCRTVIVQKEMEQWYLKITDYADRLSKDLDKIDWPKESIKRQRDWIGKKEGINITYQVEGTDETITCFTTRPDTNFGATFIVLAPEHTFVNKITNYKLKITNNQKTKETKRQEIITYVEQTKKKTELERISEGRKKTGVFTGFYAVNQLNNKKLPIWISDFVIASFGTGALVGVPGHDKRDFEFAHEFKLPIIRVVKGKDNDTSEISSIEQVQEEEGVMVNSEFLNGLNIIKAIEKMMDYLEKKGWGKRVVIYKLRDWSVSRQRFWGAPIPMIKNELLRLAEESKPDFVLQLHAWGSSPKEHFHPWLEKHLDVIGLKNASPELPNALYPKVNEWFKTAEKNLPKETKNSIVIGRSLSVWLTLMLASKYQFRKLILLAPTFPTLEWLSNIKRLITDKQAYNSVLSTIETPIDINKIQKNCKEIVFYFSTDEPYIPLKASEEYIKKNFPFARIVRIRNSGHFGESNGYTTFPKLFEEILAPVRPDLRPIAQTDLPVLLPDNVDFVPTGQSPLTYSKDFQKGVESTYGKGWKREVDTLDTFMCSSWYYYRYLDPHNDKEFASKEALKQWMPVDFYIGGTEHVTGHLLYSRFFTKVLYDAGYIDFDEPFLFHRHQGTIYGPDGRRMSKRWGNIVNPTDVVEMYGADTARVYEMFMGPLEQDKAWNDFAAKGVRRFIVRFWNLMIDEKKSNAKNSSSSLEKLLHKTIKIVGSDIQSLKYNTAIARLMEFINAWSKEKESLSKDDSKKLLLIFAPFAPFVTEEIWNMFGEKGSIHSQKWPEFNQQLIIDDSVTIPVQVNGKVRDTMIIKNYELRITNYVTTEAKKSEKVKKYLEGKMIKKTIYVPGKLVNFVVD